MKPRALLLVLAALAGAAVALTLASRLDLDRVAGWRVYTPYARWALYLIVPLLLLLPRPIRQEPIAGTGLAVPVARPSAAFELLDSLAAFQKWSLYGVVAWCYLAAAYHALRWLWRAALSL